MISADLALIRARLLFGKCADVRRLPKADMFNRKRTRRFEVGVILPYALTRVFLVLGRGRSWEAALKACRDPDTACLSETFYKEWATEVRAKIAEAVKP